MRLNYFKLGSICYTDELNALLTIYLYSQDTISENIKLDNETFEGDFANYTTHFGELIVDGSGNPILDENGNYQYMDRVDYLNEGIIIKSNILTDNNGEPILDENGNYVYDDIVGNISIDIDTEYKCKFIIYFGGNLWVSVDNKIVIDLSECIKSEKNPNGYIADEFIENDFEMLIYYNKPFIGDLKGEDGIINTTSELNQIINTSNDESITLIGQYNYETNRYEIIHDNNNPIEINNNITLTSEHEVYFINPNNINGKIFKVLKDNKLTLDNLIFDGIKENSNDEIVKGSVIENQGELNINNCQFLNCETNGFGTIYSYGNLNVNDSKFLNCSSKNGGAIFTWKDKEFFDDS